MAFFHIRAYTHPKTVSIRARKPLFFPLRAPLKGRRGYFPMGSVREAGQGLFCVKINTFQKQRKEAPDMAVFRIEKTRDYTVMSNYHLRDMSLSLKAKGLLSLMLSLPENWDYTMKGLARICKDGIDSISGGIRELEAHGYDQPPCQNETTNHAADNEV